MTDFIFWMAAIHHEKVEAYLEKLEKYLDFEKPEYLCALETAEGVHKDTQGQHIHIAAKMTLDNYKLFHDNIHLKQLKLKCKAVKGGTGKQVGKIKPENVRDETKFLIYMCKDKNIIYKNIDLKKIQEYIEKSYPKKATWEQQIYDYVKTNYKDDEYDENGVYGRKDYADIRLIIRLILNFYFTYSKTMAVPPTHLVNKIIKRFILYETKDIALLEDHYFMTYR